MISELFRIPADSILLDGSYNLALVLLSLLIAILSSAAALVSVELSRQNPLRWQQQLGLLAGSISLGIGIWSMHFIGMLAFRLCTPVDYAANITLLSLLPSVLASWVALNLLQREKIKALQLISGGVLVGAGIGTMHYSGMAAMQMAVQLRYDPGYFALSIVVAIIMATLALWIRFGVQSWQNRLPSWQLNLLSGIVMGLAISAMHYTGMLAARFVAPVGFTASDDVANSQHMALIVTSVSVLVTLLVLLLQAVMKFYHAKQSLNRSEQQFRSLIQNIPGAAYRCLPDQHWSMLFISAAVESLCGYPAKDFLLPSPRQNWAALILPEDQPLVSAINHQQTYHLEYRIRHRDGSVRWMLEHGDTLRDEQGNLIALDGFIMDITERREMEEQLRLAKQQAEQAAEVKTTFLANMSHEIRTPLNAVIGFTELLRENPNTPEAPRYLATVQQSAKALLVLLNDILDSAKLEKGKLELEQTDFNLTELLDNVVSTLWVEARNKQLELKLILDPKLKPYYFGAADRLRQVLLNLLGNAIKFTERGTVTLEVSTSASGLQIAIRDTGIGIAPERLSRIFEPFTQADASMSRRFGGTGLGTTISKQLVELMGGALTASSVPGEGSCFTVSLPLTAGKASTQISSPQQLPPLQLIIADDIEQNLDLLTAILERDQHQVRRARNGAEVLQLLTEQTPDLVLMDIQMPVMDGLTACKQRRANEQQQGLAKVPIIALTASALAEDREAVFAAGMDGFATKPIDISLLFAEIARVLQLPLSPRAATPAAASMPSQLLDSDHGSALWGSEAAHRRELQRFAAGPLQHLCEDLLTAESEQNFSRLLQQSHAYKGICGNLALPALSTACANLEHVLQQQQPQLIQPRLRQLCEVASQTRKAISALQSDIEPATAEVPTQSLATLLQVLDQQLQNFGYQDALLAQLAPFATGRWQLAVSTIVQHTEDFDFNNARKQIAALLPQLREQDD
ncbi:MAG: MHYT domain-containing protein [Alishewanella agri]|nr:MHYT domain-containing protein [Alishewanella agri]